jgi:hypothetical protein
LNAVSVTLNTSATIACEVSTQSSVKKLEFLNPDL